MWIDIINDICVSVPPSEIGRDMLGAFEPEQIDSIIELHNEYFKEN
jgi:hypothetical protein